MPTSWQKVNFCIITFGFNTHGLLLKSLNPSTQNRSWGKLSIQQTRKRVKADDFLKNQSLMLVAMYW